MAPTGPVELKLKWPQGRTMVQSMDFKQNGELTGPNLPGGAMKQDIDMGQQYSLNVLKESPGGDVRSILETKIPADVAASH